MTLDEVRAMTNEELRIKAYELAHPGSTVSKHSWREAGWKKMGYAVKLLGNPSTWFGCPDYPNDHTAARELMEHLPHEKPFQGNEFDSRDSHMRHHGAISFREHSARERCVQSLCEILEIDPIDLAYSDFGAVCYEDLWRLVSADPKTITQAFILAMEGS